MLPDKTSFGLISALFSLNPALSLKSPNELLGSENCEFSLLLELKLSFPL
jgi:hypothetical protein